MNLNLDFISEKFGDGKVAELNLSPKMGTMVKNIQKPLAFIQKIYYTVARNNNPCSALSAIRHPIQCNREVADKILSIKLK